MRMDKKEHFIVAIGGSAGSVEPLKAFFNHTPLDSAAYVIVRHMPPDSQSVLKALLERHSDLRFVEAAEGVALQPNTVYISPAHKHVVICEGRFQLVDRPEGPNRAIDLFFHSLAAEGMGTRAIAVVLSGSGFDGVKGAEAIKRAGGLVIVQDPATSEYDMMPGSTIGAGVADKVAAPAQMPAAIHAHVQESKG